MTDAKKVWMPDTFFRNEKEGRWDIAEKKIRKGMWHGYIWGRKEAKRFLEYLGTNKGCEPMCFPERIDREMNIFVDSILGQRLPIRRKFSALSHSTILSPPQNRVFDRRGLSFTSLPTGWILWTCTGIHTNTYMNMNWH